MRERDNDSAREPSLRKVGIGRAIVARCGFGNTVWALLGIAAASFLVFAPNVLNLYWLRIFSNIFMFATLAQGINIIAGYTGYPAFGNVVFFGLGGYSAAIVMVRLQGPFFVGVLVAMVVCALFVLLLGGPLLRLRGHYFAIATLGLNETIRAVVDNLSELTGGGMGLSLPLPPGEVESNAAFFYYSFLGVMALSIGVTFLLSRSRLGYACRAIRDDEVKAEAMGIYTQRYKTVAWMMSAVLTGMVGAINAYWMTYIEPAAVFDMTIAVKSFVMYLLGGAATVLGPIFGAFFIEWLLTVTWSNLLEYHIGAMGAIIILVVIFLPKGFVEFVRERGARGAVLSNRRRDG